MRSLREMGSLVGRAALVTGGAGHIGRACAEALLEAGADVILLDRDPRALEKVRLELDQPGSGRCHVLCAELEDTTVVGSLPDKVGELNGRLDILVNNAAFTGASGLSGWAAPFAEQSGEAWRRAMEVNLTVPFLLAQAFARQLEASGSGVIVNVGSIYGVCGPDWSLYGDTGMANPAAYAASKGGLLQLTRWLATTLAPRVRVNAISPGGVERGQPEAFRERYEARTPLARMAVEEDFKGAVWFLCSDLSAYVTGQNLIVDGGWTAW